MGTFHAICARILRLEGAPMPAERVLDLLRPVCSALHYAHRMGVVHCDVKPNNILVDDHVCLR